MRLARLTCLLAICLSVSASLAYFSITKYDIYDPMTGGRTGDVAQYVRIFRGESLDTIPKPYRYRIFTPYLARLVPFLPNAITQFYEITPEKVIAFKFGIANLLGITFTGVFLFLLLKALRFSDAESLIGILLFYTSFFVVDFATVPLVDAWAYAFLTLGILSAIEGWGVVLCASLFVGMFAKETTLLVLVSVVLLRPARAVMVKQIALCVPGLVAYALFRGVVFPTDVGFNYSLAGAASGLWGLLVPGQSHIYFLIDVAATYSALWILGAYGWTRATRREGDPLKRLRWLIPLVAVVPFLIGSNVGRIWFLSFPVMLPLSLLGLRALSAEHLSVRGVDDPQGRLSESTAAASS